MPNKNVESIVKIGVVGAALYYILTRLDLVQKFSVQIKGVSLGGNLLSPVIKASVAIINRTPYRSQVKLLTGEVIYNGTSIANVSFSDPTYINANGETDLEVQLYPVFNGIATTITNLISTGKVGDLAFDGYINVDGINYPIKASHLI